MKLFFRLRLLIILVVAGLALTISYWVNPENLPWLGAICFWEAVINQPFVLTRLWKKRTELRVAIHLAGDALLYTGLIHFFGGASSGILGAYYLFIIFFAAGVLRPRGVLFISALCSACLLGLFVLEELQILPPRGPLQIHLALSVKILALLIAVALFFTTGLIGAAFARLVRRQAQQLSESEARYRGVFESSSDGIYILDPEGKVVAVNPPLLEWVGLSLEQLKGRSFFQFLNEASVDDAAAMYQNVLQGERIKTREIPISLVNGRELVLEISAAPIMVQNHMVGIIGTVRDVTERKQLEMRLARYTEELEERTAERTMQLLEAKTKYQNLFEHAAVPLAWMDREGNFFSANQEMSELLGMDPGRLMSHGLAKFLCVPADQTRVSECLNRLSRDASSAGPLEVLLRRVDGGIRNAELYFHLDPNQTHVLISAIDITRRKEIEKEQQALQRELIQAEKMALVGQLAAGVAHEVNNPLTAISYYAQTLARSCAREGAPPEAHEKLRKIEEGAERIQQLLANLLTYARPQSETRQPVNLNQIVEQALNFLEHEQERHPGVTIHKKLWPDLWPVLADPAQMHQVVVNLVMNALEAVQNNQGEIVLTTRPAPEGVELVCADTGEGIRPEDLPKIFTPFFSAKSSGRGTGLGLAIVKRILEDHGGRIQVESRRGQGSSFTVFLPRAEES